MESQSAKTVVAVIGLLFFLFIGGLTLSKSKEASAPDAWKEKESKSMAYMMMEDFVKQRLKSPGSAKFPGMFEKDSHTKYLGNQTYSIVSYVDSQNSYGAMLRTNFSGKIKQVSETRWELMSLTL